ncbi:MAG: hypothetical protein N2045_14270, partial [Fimbriimonadales bacterium]|nr:hypothetical protein [Fimbriimonadales bacterium]
SEMCIRDRPCSIGSSAHLSRSLRGVAGAAQCLQVGWVEAALRRVADGDDVVDLLGGCVDSIAQAGFAERMLLDVVVAEAHPGAIVAALMG